MVTGFEQGKYYRFLGKERQPGWNSDRGMDFMLDNLPHLCTYASRNGDLASFDNDDRTWSWFLERDGDLFEEVPLDSLKESLYDLSII